VQWRERNVSHKTLRFKIFPPCFTRKGGEGGGRFQDSVQRSRDSWVLEKKVHRNATTCGNRNISLLR